MKKKTTLEKNNLLFFTIFLLACFLFSSAVRFEQYQTWKKNPSTFFVGDRPMMSTLDAPYWLRIAREYNEGNFGEKNHLRVFPESTDTFQKKRDKELGIPFQYKNSISKDQNSSVTYGYKDIPLLSFLIAHLTPFFSYNYFETGTLIIPIFASLFIFPLGLYFFKIGVPISGLLGGLIGTFSMAYYTRSSIGRIDTDMLNLFFPFLSSYLILMAVKSKSEKSILLYTISCGLSLYFFQWWYNKAGFILVYFIVLVISLALHKIPVKTILISAFLFILCAHPNNFFDGAKSVNNFLKIYFVLEETASNNIKNNLDNPAIFPNVFKTISEADTVQIEQVFSRILSNIFIVWVGFIGLFIFIIYRWKVLLPIIPILALGLLSFKSSNRFIMFLAPFVGIGLGFLINFGLEVFFNFFSKDPKVRFKDRIQIHQDSSHDPEDELELKNHNLNLIYWLRQALIYSCMGLFFWSISSKTAIAFLPMPSIPTKIYKTFLDIKNIIPNNSAILTWWDYGFAITDATELATFHDGSSQFGPKTYFIARSFLSSEQIELYKISQYLATEGEPGIKKNNTSPENLLKTVLNPKNKPPDPIYLFFTADMTSKFGAISKLGSWDIKNGGSHPKIFQNLVCNKINAEEMNCRRAVIDMKNGKVNKRIPLKRIIFVKDGYIIREKKFESKKGLTLQIFVIGKQIFQVQLIDEVVYNSNYNQMFLLGKFRNDLFEETFNAFPFSRLFRFKF